MTHKPFVPNFNPPGTTAQEQPSVARPEAQKQAPGQGSGQNAGQNPPPKPGPSPSPSQQPAQQPAQNPGYQPGGNKDHEVEVPQPNHPGQSEPQTPVGEPKTEKTQLFASESPYPQGKPMQDETSHTGSSSHGLPKAARLGDKHTPSTPSIR